MNKEFVDYKTALALKELGFNEPCFGKYDIYGSFDHKLFYHNHDSETSLNCSAPTFSQAFRWFREKYGMHHGIGFNGSWYYDIDSMKNCDEGVYEVAHKWDMETYEEAEQACLDKLIEIIKKDAHI